MAVSVGARIQSVIDHMGKNEIEMALSDVCIAVDITAEKYYGESQSSAIKIPFQHKDIKSDEQGYCTLEQIIYHVMRCGLIHGTGEDSKIIWNNRIPLALDKDGNLNLSPSFIWGLALCVIVCDVNRNEKVGETCWISTASFKYLVNDLWGKRENIKMMIKSRYNVIIEERPLC